MLSLRRKISDALGGGASGAPSSAGSAVSFSPSASFSAHDAAASLPAPLVITSAGVASSSAPSSSSSSASPPPSMSVSAPVRIPEPARAPTLSMATLGSPRAASPAVQASPLHQHQPLAPRRASVAWVPDALADKCYQCAAHFGLMLRRHHCRRCGNVFCDACSQARMPLVAAGFLTPVRVCDKCCVAAKRAHARLVDERQQQWRREQAASKDKRHRLRSMHSDDAVAYDEPAAALFPPPRGGSSSSSSTSSRRLVKSTTTTTTVTGATAPYAQSRQFIRSQTVKHLYGPPLLGGRTAVSGLVVAAAPRQFFADPYGDVDEDEEERRSLERRAGLADGSASSNSNNEVSVQTLPGEVLLVRSEGVRCRLMNQLEETEGTLYVTSFRLVFSPTIDAVPEYDEDAAATRPPVIHQAIPLGALERLKRKEMPESDMGLVDVVTKDFRHVQLFFPGLVAKQTFNQFDRTVNMIRQFAFNEPSHATEPFVRATATATATAIADDEQQRPAELPPFDGWKVYNAAAEFRRMGVGADAAIATPRWRLTDINDEYELCGTYPALLAVPASVGDQVLSVAAKYRSKSRIPVLSWRNTHTGAVICRSSQPLVGLGQRQCDKDVFLIQAISVANPSSSKFVIIDARPWKNAVAQKTVGRAGYELTEHYETRHSSATSRFADMAASSTDFGGLGASSVLPSPPSSAHTGELSYDEDDDSASSVSDRIFRQMDVSLDPSLILTECKLIFMGIENIHTMRRSYNKLLDLCIHKPTDKWVEHLGSSRWIEHISKILDSAVEIVRIVHDEKSSVLVHCSDGWDRTPQLTSLAQLMMDSYYRTIDGFQVLIEKEWCSFGHKFRDRSAHGMNPASSNDISPVFLQFIDCVWQIFRQFPCAFEFNEQFLMLILDHLYSCRFGTFMFDSEKERRDKDAARTTISLWTYIASLERTEISNPFYIPPRRVNAVSLSEAAGLLSPLASAVNAPDLDEVVASALPANPSSERDERDEDEERNSALSLFPSALQNGALTKDENEQRNSAMNLFPSALQNGPSSSSAPIKIPASEGSTAGSITPPSGLDQSPTVSPQSPALSPSARRSRAASLASSPGANGNEMTRIPGLVEEIEDDEVLRPCAWSRALQFWTRYYLRWDPSTLTDRVGSVWIETAHRELQERLEEAERQLQTLAEASQDTSDRGSGVNLPELVQTVAKSMGEEGPMTATVTFDVIEKLEALEQRKREALARIEKEFEEEAAKLLKPTMERPATAAS